MQFNQCGPYPQWNYGQFNGFIPSPPPCNPVPEITGEGEVISIVNFDGSIQFYFVPVLAYPCGFRSMNTPCINPCGAWLIKSVSNPIAATLINQQGPRRYPAIPQNQPNFMSDVNATPSYQFKFHNDGCTSTSDLHYFYPNLRTCEWIPPVPAPCEWIPSVPVPCVAPVASPLAPVLANPPPPDPVVCQERPNVEPPGECMCVDQQTTKLNKRKKKPSPCPSSSESCFSWRKRKKKKDTNTKATKRKRVRTTSSTLLCSCSSGGSVRNKNKSRKKRDDLSVTSCCSKCECMRRGTKRKKQVLKPNESSSSGLCLCSSKNKPKKQAKSASSKKQKRVRTNSSSKSLLDKIKRKKKKQSDTSISDSICTPSSCNQKKKPRVESTKSSTSVETESKNPVKTKSSGISLKRILSKICLKRKKKDERSDSKKSKPKETRSSSTVSVIFDRGSKSLHDKSEKSSSYDPTPTTSSIPLARQHCGCDTCIRCICKQKVLDCQCSKRDTIGSQKQNGSHCTCNENNTQKAKDCKRDKVTEKNGMELDCTCNEKEKKTQELGSDCKCNENQKELVCKCHLDPKENPCQCGCGRHPAKCDQHCKSRICLEKKRSNLKKLKSVQSADGDKKKRARYVCGCDREGKDDINCDEQCKYKSSLKEVTEHKKQSDCKCVEYNDNEKTHECKCGTEGNTKENEFKCGCKRDTNGKTCDKACKNNAILEHLVAVDIAEGMEIESDDTDFKTISQNGTEKEKSKQIKFKCGCERDSNKYACDKTCKSGITLEELLPVDIIKSMEIVLDKFLDYENVGNRGTERSKPQNKNKCGCGSDSDKAACDKTCKNKCNITRKAVETVEQSIAVIEPDSRLSFLQSSDGSSYFCSCRPGRCKYEALGDSCSCHSEVE